METVVQAMNIAVRPVSRPRHASMPTPLTSPIRVAKVHRLWLAVMVLPIAVASPFSGAQRSGDSRDASAMPRSSGLLAHGRDGQLLIASGARISHEASLIDKLGSFFVGLGYGGHPYDSAALCVLRLTPQGILDPSFGTSGSVMTPLLPLENRDSATATALLTDDMGRAIVVGWRDMSTWLDSSFRVIIAARYTNSGELDNSFGEHGIVTTRIDQDFVTQAFAATLDGDGRLLVAGYNGGRKVRDRRGSFDDWAIRVIVLRYTAKGVLDTTFGAGGIASREIVPGGPCGQKGFAFLRFDYDHAKAAGLILDRLGRSVVAAATGDGQIVLMRYTRNGVLDSSFGSAGVVYTPMGKHSTVSALLWDVEGRLLAVDRSVAKLAGLAIDGKGIPIVAAVSSDGVFHIRYNREGPADKSFQSVPNVRP